jgi:hypothetical protein
VERWKDFKILRRFENKLGNISIAAQLLRQNGLMITRIQLPIFVI